MTVTQVQDRRQVILDKAGALFARKGVAPTTVREIGDAVGILSGSLYHHFDSKETIAAEIVSAYVDDLLLRHQQVQARFPSDPRRCLAGLVRASFESLDAHQDACAIFQNDFNNLRDLPQFHLTLQKAREVQRIWMSVLNDGAERGVFRTDVDPFIFHRIARDAICNAARWYRRERRHDVDVVTEAYIGVLLNGFVVD